MIIIDIVILGAREYMENLTSSEKKLLNHAMTYKAKPHMLKVFRCCIIGIIIISALIIIMKWDWDKMKDPGYLDKLFFHALLIFFYLLLYKHIKFSIDAHSLIKKINRSITK